MINVLIVDDQTIVRAGFAALLAAQDDITVIGEGATAGRRSGSPSGAVPTSSSWTSGCPAWTASRPPAASSPGRAQSVRVLVLTTFDVDEYVYDALAVGASGFLLKDATADELVSAVRVVARGDSLLAPRSPGGSSASSPSSAGTVRRPRRNWRR